MKESTAKEKILKKVRKALIHKNPLPFPNLDGITSVFTNSDEPLDILFAQRFSAVTGQFIFCENEEELIKNISTLSDKKQWNNLFVWEDHLLNLFKRNGFTKAQSGKNIELADAGITFCEALIARTGSVLLSSALASGRILPVFPPVHITIAYSDQLVYDIRDGLNLIRQKYDNKLPSMINLATGPSRTADIEKTLVLGAHGPKEVYVFLIDRSAS